MRKKIVTIKFLIILCFLGFFKDQTFAVQITSEPKAATINIDRHQDFIRIVFPATDDYAQNSVVDAYISKAAKEFPDKKNLIDEPISVPFNFFMLDAGHGGYDRGIRGKNFAEKDLTLAFAREFADILAKKGKKALLTRKSDQALSITDRIKSVNQKSPEIFISIHVSSGSELVIYTSDKIREQRAENISEADASKSQVNINIDNIIKAIAENIRTEIGIGVRHESLQLPVIARVNAPAFLIELPNPENFTYDKRAKEKIINAVLKGFAHLPKGQDSGVNSN